MGRDASRPFSLTGTPKDDALKTVSPYNLQQSDCRLDTVAHMSHKSVAMNGPASRSRFYIR